MIHAALALLLLLPGVAAAQGLQSGPNAPATNAQPRGTGGPSDTGRAGPPPGDPNRTGDDPGRTAPPSDHRVLGGPAVPGATPRQDSGGFTGGNHTMPTRPGARPDASTTGR